MPYVSAMYAPPDPILDNPPLGSGKERIVALDDVGRFWYLTADSQVGDWLEYVKNGGTIAPYDTEVYAEMKNTRV